MWKCTKCSHKNNNSSERCHGKECKQVRPFEWEKRSRPTTLDWCQWCDDERTFVMVGKNKWGQAEWSCTICHKKSIRKSKYNPEKHKKPIMTVPEDTGDGAN